MEPLDAVATARDAYVWGYPLVVLHRTRARHCSRVPLGSLDHRERLATPESRTVVAPNNDTLYSSGWFDLSTGDVLVEVPPIERYWSVMVLDAYSHVAYVSRRTHGTSGARVRLTLDPGTEPPRPAGDVLPFPTPTVWVLVRTLVDGPDDLAAAVAVQRGITVTPSAGHPHHTTERLGRPDRVHEAGAGVLDELAAALAIDPPGHWHPQPPPGVVDLLAHLDSVDRDDLARGVELGEAQIASSPPGSGARRDGWGTNPTGSDVGDDVLRRASTAKYALAAHHPTENRSYIAQHDDGGERLDGSRPLTLRFGPGDPPCDGFWSLTVYGPDVFLVANPIDRYSIGDRTPGLRRDADGSLAITVGGPAPADTSGWLPAPDGPYVLALRVYEGRPEVVDHRWFPPPLQRA